jgi:ketosteroid isomerase-like protein
MAEDGAERPGSGPLDIVRRWYATLDPALLSEAADWRVLDTFPAGGRYLGRVEILTRFFPALTERFASYETRPERFLAEGDTVVVIGAYHARGLSGRQVQAAFAHVWTVRNGTLASFRQVADTAAMAAVLD